jgi:hypothetical protein
MCGIAQEWASRNFFPCLKNSNKLMRRVGDVDPKTGKRASSHGH